MPAQICLCFVPTVTKLTLLPELRAAGGLAKKILPRASSVCLWPWKEHHVIPNKRAAAFLAFFFLVTVAGRCVD